MYFQPRLFKCKAPSTLHWYMPHLQLYMWTIICAMHSVFIIRCEEQALGTNLWYFKETIKFAPIIFSHTVCYKSFTLVVQMDVCQYSPSLLSAEYQKISKMHWSLHHVKLHNARLLSFPGRKQSFSAILLLLDWCELAYFLSKSFSKYGRHPLGKHRWTVYHRCVISYFPLFRCLVPSPLSWTSLPPFCFLHYLNMIHLRRTACDILGHAATKRPSLAWSADSSLKAFICLGKKKLNKIDIACWQLVVCLYLVVMIKWILHHRVWR